MSQAFVTQPSTSYGGQTGVAFGAFANSNKGCFNGVLCRTASGLCSMNRRFEQSDSASLALSVRKSKKSGTKPNLMRLNVGTHIVAAGNGNSDRNVKSNSKVPAQGNEKTTSRRLKVVSNAAPMTVRSATGLLIPLSIVDSEHEDPEEEKYVDANVFNQLLIQKNKVAVKKRRANRFAEEEEEITGTAKNLHISETSKDSHSLPLSDLADNYESTLMDLIDQVEGIRLHALALERWHAPQLKKVHRQYYASARNLLHYVAFRSLDIADLQERLASSGLSSLEGCEAHTLATVNSIGSILRSLLHGSQIKTSRFDGNTEHKSFQSPSISERQGVTHNGQPTNSSTPAMDVSLNTDEDISFQAGNSLLLNHAEVLLGPSPPGRKTVVMVTLPSEAAEDDVLVRNLFKSGMNIARINCAHDNPEVWKKMVRKVRFFSQLLETPCRISFDLAGPKLRTGPMQPGPSVLKIKPLKDSLGEVVAPACIWIAEEGVKPMGERIPDACVPVVASSKWAKKIQIGDIIKFKDARGRLRELHVVEKGSGAARDGIYAECRSVSYITSGCELAISRHGGKKLKVNVGQLPDVEQAIVLRVGDKLLLKRDSVLGSPAQLDKAGQVVVPASVTCTLAKVFDVAKPGEPVKFDDGKIGGVISSVSSSEICVTITEAGDHKGRKLKGEKAINFPESDLSTTGLTVKDAGDLDFVVANADILALSFVNGPADVRVLQNELARRGADKIGIVVKIETELGFQRLPSILLQAMETKNPVGVMVARGDMAVECGWQRLAEIQDQILLICESAHVPTIWATQVLEGLAKSGLPSRAEITDAASGSRAECVMLNKGPYILQAVASLDDILCREASHRRKNQSVLHPLQNLHNLGM
ncbi:hypothetical protein M758_2G097600 [Ceratodon purpureus]|nr:hypothetical protein M758_2G097600 [Ceratodon purpureus]